MEPFLNRVNFLISFFQFRVIKRFQKLGLHDLGRSSNFGSKVTLTERALYSVIIWFYHLSRQCNMAIVNNF